MADYPKSWEHLQAHPKVRKDRLTQMAHASTGDSLHHARAL
jgi:hypothetical protein